MDTRNSKKSAEAANKTGEDASRMISDTGNLGTEVQSSSTQSVEPQPPSRVEEWKYLCHEYNENLNTAINVLAVGKKQAAPQLCIYFEKIIPIMKVWLTSHEEQTPQQDHPLHREYLRYVIHTTTVLKPKLSMLKTKGVAEEVIFTAIDYRSYANIEQAAAESRNSVISRSSLDDSMSVRSILSHPPSVSSIQNGRENYRDPPHRAQRRGRRRNNNNRAEVPYAYDHYETPELLKEFRRYRELPAPWNKMPTQSLRQERLDVSRQVQLAGERQFKGDIDDYVRWRDFFLGTIGDIRCHARHKVNALRKSLDAVLETVVDFVPGDFNGYKQIIENLEKSYGGTFRQLSRYDDYFDTSRIKYGMLDQFREYVRKVAGYKSLLSTSGDTLLFATPHVYRRMLLPLPSGHVRELQTWLHTERLEPSASNLLAWGQDRLDRLLTEKEVDRRKQVLNKQPQKTKAKAKILETIIDPETDSGPEEYESCQEQDENTTSEDDKPVIIKYIALKPPTFCLLACTESHPLDTCPWFLALVPEMRRSFIRHWKVLTCFSCLGFAHSSRNCGSKGACEVCKQKTHHTLLHMDREKVTLSLFINFANIKLGKLPCVSVKVSRCSSNALSFYVNAIIDTGANVTVVSNYVRKRLNSHDAFAPMTLNTAAGKVSKKVALVTFDIWTVDEKRIKITAICFDKDEPFADAEIHDTDKWKAEFPYLNNVPLPEVEDKSINVLFGNDHPGLTSPLEVIRGPTESHPVAERCKLGWSVRGPSETPTSLKTNIVTEDEDAFGPEKRMEVLDLMKRISDSWELEERIGKDYVTPEDRIAESILANTMRLEEGFVQSGILWKETLAPRVLNNRPLAVRRLSSLLRMLKQREEVRELYEKNFAEWISEEILIPVSERAPEGKTYYLSHFPVVRMDKSTTKVRTVVDAAARYRGSCLNDYILAGPNLANDVRRVLLRFRYRAIAIMGDVRAMFTRIKLLKNERSYHRVLWGTDMENIKEFEFTRFTFGNACSPSVAVSAARYLTEFFSESYERAKEAIIKSTVVDDTLDSVDSEEEAIALLRKIQEIYAKGSMSLRKIGSNKKSVMEAFPSQEVSQEISFAFESVGDGTKTLGVKWSPVADTLVHALDFEELPATRRQLLSQLAKIYDPLGMISPLLINLKILIQSTWRSDCSWDMPLPPELLQDWKKALERISGEIRFRRPLMHTTENEVIRKRIDIFCDASDKALGAVAFLTIEYRGGMIDTNLIIASSRVAPLKFTTIPRLELQACIEGLRIAEHISEALGWDMRDMHYWTDSMDVVQWLRTASRSLKVFVGSRIGQIQRKTCIERWNWVPTGSNPADLLSRGTSLRSLNISELWRHGPVFLRDETQLPVRKSSSYSEAATKELKRQRRIRTLKIVVVAPYWNSKLKRFSDWNVFLRAIVNILKIIYRNRPLHLLCSDALYRAIALLQEELMGELFQDLRNEKAVPPSHPYAKYRLYYNLETRAIHASGRLSHAEHLPFLTRFPLFVPPKTHLATLIIRSIHQHQMQHMGGVKSLIAYISATFAIPYLSYQAKRILRLCVFCKRLNFRPSCPTPAPLPAFRLPQQQRTEVFDTAAMDCFGPLMITENKTKTVQTRKVYVLVITCTLYRAVHLEVIESLSSDSFMLAFERFVATRNRPKRVVSDNGRNFLGTWNILEKVFTSLPQRLQTRYPMIQWLFNTPLDPHKGGVFERIVGLTKNNLAKLLKQRRASLEEFHTMIKLIESALNNRPLETGQQDMEEEEILTPNHFIRGSKYNTIAPNTTDMEALKTWRKTQQLLNTFWKQFVNGYITSLNIGGMKKHQNRKFKAGQMVIVQEEMKHPVGINFPTWPLGRIIEVYPGKDGIVRSVKLKVKGKEYVRGVTKIMPLLE